MLFGIGNAHGIIITIILDLLPLERFTNLGGRQVPQDSIEATKLF